MSGIKEVLKRFSWARAINAAISGPKPTERSVDLGQIGLRTIAPNVGFDKTALAAKAVEGMLSRFSMAVLDMLLSVQDENGTVGNLMEIGTYRGKSAVILGRHLRADERLALVDIHDYLDRNAIESFKESVDFLLTPSDKLRGVLPATAANIRPFAFFTLMPATATGRRSTSSRWRRSF